MFQCKKLKKGKLFKKKITDFKKSLTLDGKSNVFPICFQCSYYHPTKVLFTPSKSITHWMNIGQYWTTLETITKKPSNVHPKKK
jgi:hypothetical protein